MSTIHDYAEVLHALADKKDTQVLTNTAWRDVSAQNTLRLIIERAHPPTDFRVKPATVVINGVDCPDRYGQPTDHTVTVTWRSERERKGRELHFYYADRQGAEMTFNALVSPLGAITE